MAQPRSLPWLPEAPRAFPSPAQAGPDGLLAAGGSLDVSTLRRAYGAGIFPWFDEDAPILWWSPNPRAVLLPSALRIRRSLRKTLRHGGFHCTMDEAFKAVVEGCAAPRRDGGGTWLTEEMQAAYGAAHDAGLAHSLEVWKNGTLAGGLYGMALGRCFFGESMFSTVRDASKVGLVHLCGQLAAWNFALLDCQVGNPHTEFLGARPLARDAFLRIVAGLTGQESLAPQGPWTLRWSAVLGSEG
ncbi:MAG: leucyl/phenylalanyl-tRNA--protein transferase [Pseudomonadales bacterium]